LLLNVTTAEVMEKSVKLFQKRRKEKNSCDDMCIAVYWRSSLAILGMGKLSQLLAARYMHGRVSILFFLILKVKDKQY
jgi:hypothetical protein